jgi:FkbM family methyltransferase
MEKHMLIKFKDITEKYEIPRGIIHIGAHLREERNDYLAMGINNLLWIEGNKKVYQTASTGNFLENELFFNEVMADKDGETLEFKITNNGESSSILELEKHKVYHPHIYVTETVKVKTKRFDTLVKENNVDISKYNFLNLDIQGAELLALKGFGDLLSGIDYVYTEVNETDIYKDCALIGEIDNYLSDFERVETFMTQFKWGDALYRRKK